MNLKQLKYFKVLAETEHMTKSAEMLFITQPSLSHSINELENELNIPLFEKKGRNIKLTKYGQVFLEYVNGCLTELNTGINKINSMTSPETGNIDLAFIYTTGSEFVPKLIKNFKEKHKGINFTFQQSNTKNIIAGLKQGIYDIAFCSKIDSEETIEFLEVIKQDVVLITPKNHPLSKNKKICLTEVEQYPIVTFNKQSGIRPLIDYLFKKASIIPNIVCEVEEDHTLIGFVLNHFGIALVPRLKVLDLYDIEIIEIDNYGFTRYIHLAYIKDRFISPPNQLFINYVKEYSKLN